MPIMQSALATPSAELDEVAAVGGANAWRRFWRIRQPLLRPAILVALIIRTVEAFRVFDMAYVITQGGPAFGNQGRGAALSFLIAAFTLTIAFIYIRFLYRPEDNT